MRHTRITAKLSFLQLEDRSIPDSLGELALCWQVGVWGDLSDQTVFPLEGAIERHLPKSAQAFTISAESGVIEENGSISSIADEHDDESRSWENGLFLSFQYPNQQYTNGYNVMCSGKNIRSKRYDIALLNQRWVVEITDISSRPCDITNENWVALVTHGYPNYEFQCKERSISDSSLVVKTSEAIVSQPDAPVAPTGTVGALLDIKYDRHDNDPFIGIRWLQIVEAQDDAGNYVPPYLDNQDAPQTPFMPILDINGFFDWPQRQNWQIAHLWEGDVYMVSETAINQGEILAAFHWGWRNRRLA